MSGFKIVYDVREPVGSRVKSVMVRTDVSEEEFVDLDEEKLYYVVTSNYIVGGGDGYTMLHDNKTSHFIGDLDMDVMRREVMQHSPIMASLEDRIIIHSDKSEHTELNKSVDLMVCDMMVFVLSLLSANLL